jgi:two-component system sensor histidine kinase DegS
LVDFDKLEQIIDRTKEVVENSKKEIYQVGEEARQDYKATKRELEKLKPELMEIINEVDELDKRFNQSKKRLAEVSSNFNKFGENEIKEAYHNAHNYQLKLISMREKEKMMRLQRDHLERHLKSLEMFIERSEVLIGNVGMVLKILGNDLQSVSMQLGEMKQLHALGLSAIIAQEEERKRVAREIHDGPAQSLANIVMRAEFCLKIMELNPDMLKDELYGLMDLVRKSLQDVRKIIFDLRPMSLDDLGLVPALKRYTEKYAEDNGIFVEITVMGTEYDLDSSLVVAIFRVIQESLTNIRKHAKATDVVIKIEYMPQKVSIVVRDNGCGFDVEKVLNEKNGKAFGLIGMRERIQLINGKFEIKSIPGQGSEVIFSVPTSKFDLK